MVRFNLLISPTIFLFDLAYSSNCMYIHVFGNSALSDYLNWRDNIFYSTSRDTSLLQMLPCWFPKAVRRLIMLYIQVYFVLHFMSLSPVCWWFDHLFFCLK